MRKQPGVAVIGSGIAGLTAAYLLQRAWPVTLYEADKRLGGHAHTHHVWDSSLGTELALDTGFLVHNEANYPLLTRLFRELGVNTEVTDMSFSVHCAGCGIGYSSGSGLRSLPRRLRDAAEASGTDLATEMSAFNAHAREILADGAEPGLTLEKMLVDGGYSESFAAHVVLPLVSILWSCDPATAGSYPAGSLLAFLDNHGMLRAGDATRWRTVSGGAATYVGRVSAGLSDVISGVRVRAIRRSPDGVEVRDAADEVRRHDRVVIATHPAEALAMLVDPTPIEQAVLGALPYIRNTAVLHTDASQLPGRRVHRSSWNHWQYDCRAGSGETVVTYWLNMLQNIESATDYLVTLGAVDRVAPGEVLARMEYEHPVYTVESAAARARLPELNSARTAYAGAYHGSGFHEDGCRAGAAAAAWFGVGW